MCDLMVLIMLIFRSRSEKAEVCVSWARDAKSKCVQSDVLVLNTTVALLTMIAKIIIVVGRHVA